MKVMKVYSNGLKKILNKEINNIPGDYYCFYIGETIALMDSSTDKVVATVFLNGDKRISYYEFAEFYDISNEDFETEERYIDCKLYAWCFENLKIIDPQIKIESNREATVFEYDIESLLKENV